MKPATLRRKIGARFANAKGVHRWGNSYLRCNRCALTADELGDPACEHMQAYIVKHYYWDHPEEFLAHEAS